MDATDTVTDGSPSNLSNKNSSIILIAGSFSNVNVLDDHELYFNMSGDKYLIIFNHFEYKKSTYFGGSRPLPRSGTHQDCKSLRETFEDLDFKVYLHQDLDYERIIDEVISITKADHASTSCVIVAILTHGATGGELMAADRPYNLNDILILFENGHQSLVAKPKLFFVQACRGDSMDDGRVVTDAGDDRGRVSYTLPTHANFLILYSTVENFVSFRDRRGSWLIQDLCAVIRDHSDSMDFLQLITVVNARVARERASYSTRKENSDKRQMPETRFTLTKLLRLSSK